MGADDVRVLVATAHLRARAELTVALAVEGALVAEAGSAREAFAAAVRDRPDVLVVDLDTGFDGLALLRVLQERGATVDHVVALAHPDDPATLAEAHLLGVERHVMVPAEIDGIVVAVGEAVTRPVTVPPRPRAEPKA